MREMEQISLDIRRQKRLKKKANKIKEKIKSGKLTIRKNSKKRVKKSSKKTNQRGVIYIGRIPHGFYEDELRSYFSQFGVVTRVKVARSKKTGRSKGYGFVEFLEKDVAKVAAETMNNYLMFNCILKCRYIPPEEQRTGMFVRTIHSTNYPRIHNRAKNIQYKNKSRSIEEDDFRRARTERKIEEFKRFFQERGIEFNFKINDPELSVSGDEFVANGTFEQMSESESSAESEGDCLSDDENGVLEIDESDDEIEFVTPPNVKKVIKRYSTQARKYV